MPALLLPQDDLFHCFSRKNSEGPVKSSTNNPHVDLIHLSMSICFSEQAVESQEQRYRSVIWGPTCDCFDKIIDNYVIPELHIGDWLLVDDIGAYSITLCSGFNGFERAQIYCVATSETRAAWLKP